MVAFVTQPTYRLLASQKTHRSVVDSLGSKPKLPLSLSLEIA